MDRLRGLAREEGFNRLAVAPAVEPQGFSHLADWISRGYAGEMHYFQSRLEAYRDPSGVLEGARSVVMLTHPYPAAAAEKPREGHGKLARYLWTADDYHDWIHPKLKRLRRALLEEHPSAMVRGVVDTAPLMERDFARLAGLGWQGKNTLLIDKLGGSYFFLAALVTDLVLPVDESHQADHCGTCRRCLEACPTDAFPQPGVLDATRCISYLTIEQRGPIPEPLREKIGDWVFGCDVCQEVCPWNRKPTRAAERETEPEPWTELPLEELFELDEEAFRRRFRRTPLWRARRRGLLRNAAVVLGNQRSPAALRALALGIADDESLVRGAAAWAIGRIGGLEARRLLEQRRAVESDAETLYEIEAAIAVLAAHECTCE